MMLLATTVVFVMVAIVLSETVTPVQKVLQMMEDMKSKGLKEKDAEIVSFKALSMYCKDTIVAKEKAVSDADDEIEKLSADIERYNSDAAVLGKQIRKLDKATDKGKTQKASGTEKWTTEEEDYKELHAQYGQNIADMQVGTAQLKAMMASGGASLLQQTMSTVHLPEKAKKLLQSYLETSTYTELAASAPETGAFESQSSPVLDLMDGLTKKMEEEKVKLEQDHVKSRGAYQMIQQTLFSQIDQHTSLRNLKAGTKKDKEASSAEAEGDKASTEVSKASDEAFLQDVYSECATKSSEYESNQKIRSGEVTALNKAIEIIAGGAVSGASEKHLPQLLQSSAASLVQFRNGLTKKPSQSIAASFLQAQARELNSRVLAALSLRVAEDPFGKVKKLIQDMVYKLMEEANEEAEHKGFCDTELGTNKMTREKKTTTADELTATIDELTSQISLLGNEISILAEEVSDSDAAVSEATSIRTEEKAKNTETIAEASQAGTAVKQALGVLQSYYDGLSLLQRTSKTAARNPAQSGSSTGVIGMLEVILSDFQRLESSTKASEETNQASFEKFTTESSQVKAVKQQHIKNKSETRTEHDLNMRTAQKDLENTQAELKAAEDYFEKLKPSCVETGNSYEDRVARRKEEIESLKEAIKILDENDIA